MSTHTYTIKEVESLTGLPESTLRYYESIGVVKPIERDISSKHRVYSEEDLNGLDSVACLNATGMSLADMRQYIKNRTQGAEVAKEQATLLQTQRQRLKNEAVLLKVRQHYVDLKIAYWQAVDIGDTKQAEELSTQAKTLATRLKFSDKLSKGE